MTNLQLSHKDIQHKKNLSELVGEKRFRVAIFGSARVKPTDPLYQEVSDFAHKLAEKGYDIVTGGGPGVMAAASRGHHMGCEKGNQSESIGINIQLPWEQAPNPYLDVSETSPTFSKRLDTFMLLSDVFVITPGGIGTLLELFYTWQLMQVHHICHAPIILWGEDYVHLTKFIQSCLVTKGFVAPHEANLAIQAHNMDQVLRLIDIAYDSYKDLGDKACININQYITGAKSLGIIE